MQGGDLSRLQGTSRPLRMDPGSEQCLARVNVSDSCDTLLVQQSVLDGRPRALQHPVEPASGEALSQWLGAEGAIESCPFPGFEPAEASQPSYVVIVEAPTVIQLENRHDVTVARGIGSLVPQSETPGHSNLGLKNGFAIESKEQVLSAPVDAADTPTLQLAGEGFGRWEVEDQVAAANPRDANRALPQLGIEVPTDDLDFR